MKAAAICEFDSLVLHPKEEVIIRIAANEVRVQGRYTQGMRIRNERPWDEGSTVARIV